MELKNRKSVPQLPVTLFDVRLRFKIKGKNKLVFTEPFVWQTHEGSKIKIDTVTCITIFVRQK